MSESMSQLAENKLILLYLINKMSMPLSNSEICLFALEKDYMDYFSLQQYLGELVDSEFLEVTKEKQHYAVYSYRRGLRRTFLLY